MSPKKNRPNKKRSKKQIVSTVRKKRRSVKMKKRRSVKRKRTLKLWK